MKILASLLLVMIQYLTLSAQENRIALLQNLEKGSSSLQQNTKTATLKSASRLFADQNDLTSVILVVPSGSSVEVLGSDSTYLHVIYDDMEGYILSRHAVITQAVTRQEAPVVQQQKPVQSQQQNEQISRFSYLENKYGSSVAARLMQGKVWKGMLSEMVRDSWGEPQKINRVISGNTVKEEWIFRNTWLYIENNYLVEWGPISR